MGEHSICRSANMDTLGMFMRVITVNKNTILYYISTVLFRSNFLKLLYIPVLKYPFHSGNKCGLRAVHASFRRLCLT